VKRARSILLALLLLAMPVAARHFVVSAYFPAYAGPYPQVFNPVTFAPPSVAFFQCSRDRLRWTMVASYPYPLMGARLSCTNDASFFPAQMFFRAGYY